ncbi:MAG: hypothetical protein ACREOO_06615, partial [bacterium]
KHKTQSTKFKATLGFCVLDFGLASPKPLSGLTWALFYQICLVGELYELVWHYSNDFSRWILGTGFSQFLFRFFAIASKLEIHN